MTITTIQPSKSNTWGSTVCWLQVCIQNNQYSTMSLETDYWTSFLGHFICVKAHSRFNWYSFNWRTIKLCFNGKHDTISVCTNTTPPKLKPKCKTAEPNNYNQAQPNLKKSKQSLNLHVPKPRLRVEWQSKQPRTAKEAAWICAKSPGGKSLFIAT